MCQARLFRIFVFAALNLLPFLGSPYCKSDLRQRQKDLFCNYCNIYQYLRSMLCQYMSKKFTVIFCKQCVAHIFIVTLAADVQQ